ncbi:mercury resistance system transport protein MerF [uncultured Salinisphaera sp.]|jgi:mercuric ion transport protein|uniref:mercury resistance system transport protein MerF n=1 Tax=uncultured Salinisphaera sp. TaxID=359372 RepID=UPI0032B23AA9|tara:strand:- start:337 stop:549 length:213 start_codon:yes stop_codon:yes gene_type:complete
MNRNNTLLGAGIVGTVIAALCCFTPVLVILFGVVGLSALVGYLDYVLLPALVFFLGLTVYAVYRHQKTDC